MYHMNIRNNKVNIFLLQAHSRESPVILMEFQFSLQRI